MNDRTVFESRLNRLLAGSSQALFDAVAASRTVFRIAHLLEARIDVALTPLGIDMRGYLAIAVISDEQSQPLRPADLGVTLDASRVQVTRLLDVLEAKGLILRLPSKLDRRSLRLALTPAGRAVAKKSAKLVHPIYLAAWQVLGETGTAGLLEELRRVHAELSFALGDE